MYCYCQNKPNLYADYSGCESDVGENGTLMDDYLHDATRISMTEILREKYPFDLQHGIFFTEDHSNYNPWSTYTSRVTTYIIPASEFPNLTYQKFLSENLDSSPEGDFAIEHAMGVASTLSDLAIGVDCISPISYMSSFFDMIKKIQDKELAYAMNKADQNGTGIVIVHTYFLSEYRFYNGYKAYEYYDYLQMQIESN